MRYRDVAPFLHYSLLKFAGRRRETPVEDPLSELCLRFAGVHRFHHNTLAIIWRGMWIRPYLDDNKRAESMMDCHVLKFAHALFAWRTAKKPARPLAGLFAAIARR